MNPDVILMLLVVGALAIYAVVGGADFGAGVWEFNTNLRSSDSEKRLLYKAIGPVWEANHVWLIFVLIVLWTGFPHGFAAICRIAAMPLALALVGIVFRGAAYAFRSSMSGLPHQRRVWEPVFALASTAAPFFLGCTIGCLASEQPSISSDGQFSGSWLSGWISLQSVFFGFFAVGICSFLASVFLTREARAFDRQNAESHPDDAANHTNLENTWRIRALAMGWVVGSFSIAGLVIAATRMPTIWSGIMERAWPATLVAIASGIATIGFTLRRNDWLATISASLTVGSVLLGWAWAQYPYVVIPNITIHDVDTPDNVMWLTIWCIIGGLFVIAPPMTWLYYLFKKNKIAGSQGGG
ncbi:MAG: cytochrome d ubiquinol oxidase subunit II [Aureliella sp.]